MGKLHEPQPTAVMEPRAIRDIASALFLYYPSPEITLVLLQEPVAVTEFLVVEVDVSVWELRSRNKAPWQILSGYFNSKHPLWNSYITNIARKLL